MGDPEQVDIYEYPRQALMVAHCFSISGAFPKVNRAGAAPYLSPAPHVPFRNLILVLGDQLSPAISCSWPGVGDDARCKGDLRRRWRRETA